MKLKVGMKFKVKASFSNTENMSIDDVSEIDKITNTGNNTQIWSTWGRDFYYSSSSYHWIDIFSERYTIINQTINPNFTHYVTAEKSI